MPQRGNMRVAGGFNPRREAAGEQIPWLPSRCRKARYRHAAKRQYEGSPAFKGRDHRDHHHPTVAARRWIGFPSSSRYCPLVQSQIALIFRTFHFLYVLLLALSLELNCYLVFFTGRTGYSQRESYSWREVYNPIQSNPIFNSRSHSRPLC